MASSLSASVHSEIRTKELLGHILQALAWRSTNYRRMESIPQWSIAYDFMKMSVSQIDGPLRNLYHEQLLPLYYSSSDPEKSSAHGFILDVLNDPLLREVFYPAT